MSSGSLIEVLSMEGEDFTFKLYCKDRLIFSKTVLGCTLRDFLTQADCTGPSANYLPKMASRCAKHLYELYSTDQRILYPEMPTACAFERGEERAVFHLIPTWEIVTEAGQRTKACKPWTISEDCHPTVWESLTRKTTLFNLDMSRTYSYVNMVSSPRNVPGAFPDDTVFHWSVYTT